MNWGKGITIALVLFMGFIVYLVVVLISQNVNLESEDYYQKDVAYEKEINALTNANNLGEKPTITLTESHVLVKFSDQIKHENTRLVLKRPNNDELDQRFDIRQTNTFTIDRKTLQPGMYNAELSYTIGDKSYLQKQQIYI